MHFDLAIRDDFYVQNRIKPHCQPPVIIVIWKTLTTVTVVTVPNVRESPIFTTSCRPWQNFRESQFLGFLYSQQFSPHFPFSTKKPKSSKVLGDSSSKIKIRSRQSRCKQVQVMDFTFGVFQWCNPSCIMCLCLWFTLFSSIFVVIEMIW
jgi:hypothetical protein